MVKNPPAKTGATGDLGSIPGSGRSPGRGNGKPLQYSCLENPMERRAWWATVHRVHKELDATGHACTLVFKTPHSNAGGTVKELVKELSP